MTIRGFEFVDSKYFVRLIVSFHMQLEHPKNVDPICPVDSYGHRIWHIFRTIKRTFCPPKRWEEMTMCLIEWILSGTEAWVEGTFYFTKMYLKMVFWFSNVK